MKKQVLKTTDDGAPLAWPTVEQTEQAGIVAADCCRWCVHCSRIEGEAVRFRLF